MHTFTHNRPIISSHRANLSSIFALLIAQTVLSNTYSKRNIWTFKCLSHCKFAALSVLFGQAVSAQSIYQSLSADNNRAQTVQKSIGLHAKEKKYKENFFGTVVGQFMTRSNGDVH